MCTDQFGTGVGDDLDDLADIEFGGDRRPGLVQNLELSRFIPDRIFGQARFGDVVALNEDATGMAIGQDRLVDKIQIIFVRFAARAVLQIDFRAAPHERLPRSVDLIEQIDEALFADLGQRFPNGPAE